MKHKSLAVFLILFSSVSLFAEKYYISFEQSEYEVSSYLKEKNTSYSKECLSANNPKPWVPAGGNNGKDSYIEFKNCQFNNDFYISIGYVSKERPDLYKKNSRPKVVSVYYSDKGITKTFELKDTPDPQKITLFDDPRYGGRYVKENDKIIISFPEVYEGTQYKDLCINFIAKGILEVDSIFDFGSSKYNDAFAYAINLEKSHFANIWNLKPGLYSPFEAETSFPGNKYDDDYRRYLLFVSKEYVALFTERLWDRMLQNETRDFTLVDNYLYEDGRYKKRKLLITNDSINLIEKNRQHEIIFKLNNANNEKIKIQPNVQPPYFILTHETNVYSQPNISSKVIYKTSSFKQYKEYDGSINYMPDESQKNLDNNILEITGSKLVNDTVMFHVKNNSIEGWISNSDLTIFTSNKDKEEFYNNGK